MKDINIIVTGAAGFIGSCMVEFLNKQGLRQLILVDNFSIEQKKKNWQSKIYLELVERDMLFDWLENTAIKIEAVIHLGAKTDTTEFDYSIHEKLNVQYSKDIWNYCTKNGIPLIYASSAATYGAGDLGYDDNHEVVEKLQPLNPYGISKNEFDKWTLKQPNQPISWTGLKFFNVYGPNEYHKGRMASVIFHSINQIKANAAVRLFRSHRDGFNDGEQLRDFVYVKDLVKVIVWMLRRMVEGQWVKANNGLYNLGTGQARSFYDLAKAAFNSLDMPPIISFIDMPLNIRDKYQYFTEANMSKLRMIGYYATFYTLEEGVSDYVRNYLAENKYF